jgi:hypothetical protein
MNIIKKYTQKKAMKKATMLLGRIAILDKAVEQFKEAVSNEPNNYELKRKMELLEARQQEARKIVDEILEFAQA